MNADQLIESRARRALEMLQDDDRENIEALLQLEVGRAVGRVERRNFWGVYGEGACWVLACLVAAVGIGTCVGVTLNKVSPIAVSNSLRCEGWCAHDNNLGNWHGDGDHMVCTCLTPQDVAKIWSPK